MIDRQSKKRMARARRQHRVRAKVQGSAVRPRLSVFRSATHTSAQIINDDTRRTLVAVSDMRMTASDRKKIIADAGARKAKTAIAFALGKMIAEKAKSSGITTVVFDRNGFAYTGRVAALADGAREGGLIF